MSGAGDHKTEPQTATPAAGAGAGAHAHPASPAPAVDQTEAAKKLAAYRAVDMHVTNGQKIGVGSGSTIVYAVQRLAERYHNANAKEKLSDIVCVPTSFQATSLIVEAKLPLGDLSRYPELDVAIDGADEVDEWLNLIKGGGGCALQEKIVAFNAKQLVIICDYRKESKRLGQKYRRVPLEVVPFAYVPVMNRCAQQLKAKVTLRMAQTKAGPTVTDSGNFIVDCDWGAIEDPHALDRALHAIPGIVETGLFVDMCHTVYFGQANGTVTVRSRPPNKSGSLSGRGSGATGAAAAVAEAIGTAAAAGAAKAPGSPDAKAPANKPT